MNLKGGGDWEQIYGDTGDSLLVQTSVILRTLPCNFNFLWITCPQCCSKFDGIVVKGVLTCRACGRTSANHNDTPTGEPVQGKLEKGLEALTDNWLPKLEGTNITLHFWYDSRYDNAPTGEYPGITLHDLEEATYDYVDFPGADLYYKIDYAKFVILLNQTSEPGYSCFLDIDLDPSVLLDVNVANIEVLGYLMNEKRVGIGDFENQFIMVKNGEDHVTKSITSLLEYVKKTYNEHRDKMRVNEIDPHTGAGSGRNVQGHQNFFECHRYLYLMLYKSRLQGSEVGVRELLGIKSRASSRDYFSCDGINDLLPMKDRIKHPGIRALGVPKEILFNAKIYINVPESVIRELREYNGELPDFKDLISPFSINDFMGYLRDRKVIIDEFGVALDSFFIYLTVDIGIYRSRFD